jgi:uncharacterized protein
MATVVHFEIPADDLARAKKFYETLFGWKIEGFGDEPQAEYYMIGTTDKEGKQSLGGGMMARKTPQNTTTNYIGVPSIEAFAAKVESLGGRVVVPKTPVPNFGYFAVCLDTENNAFGLWEDL